MNFDEFARIRKYCYVAENGFLIWKITPDEPFNPCELSVRDSRIVVHIIVDTGTIDVKFKGRVYHLEQNAYGHFIGGPTMELLSASGNVNAYLMACTDSYNATLFKNSPPMPFSLAEKAHEQPVNTLGQDEMIIFRYRMNCLEMASMNEEHIFRNEMIKCGIWMFLLDLTDIHIRKEAKNCDKQTGRKKEIFITFMKLLASYVCQEHTVGFYASKLCITPQYLNRIVKCQSDKTAYEWICLSLVGEIAKQLETSTDTMQQIAHNLNFPDQVTLTKFFKRQTGYSLSEYRKKMSV